MRIKENGDLTWVDKKPVPARVDINKEVIKDPSLVSDMNRPVGKPFFVARASKSTPTSRLKGKMQDWMGF